MATIFRILLPGWFEELPWLGDWMINKDSQLEGKFLPTQHTTYMNLIVWASQRSLHRWRPVSAQKAGYFVLRHECAGAYFLVKGSRRESVSQTEFSWRNKWSFLENHKLSSVVAGCWRDESALPTKNQPNWAFALLALWFVNMVAEVRSWVRFLTESPHQTYTLGHNQTGC